MGPTGREIGRAVPLAHDVVVRVVEPEHGPTTRPERSRQRLGEPAMVLHVVQHEEAGDGIEATFKLWMRLAQIANPDS